MNWKIVNQRELAREAEIDPCNLNKYVNGSRKLSKLVRQRLLNQLRHHQRQLKALIKELKNEEEYEDYKRDRR